MRTERTVRLGLVTFDWESARSVVLAMWKRFNDRRLVGLASESALWLLLALLPLAAVSGMFAARVALSNDAALGVLSHSLPKEARQMLTTELTKVAAYNGGHIGLVASVMFVWLASSGVAAMFDVFEVATDSVPRTWLRKRLLGMGCCVALAIGMAAIAVLVGNLEEVGEAVKGEPIHQSSHIMTGLRLMIGAAVDLLLTAGMYRIGVGQTALQSTIFPGALLAVILQIAIGTGYAMFIHELGDGSTYLAGLAVFGVTITAVFIFTLSLLLGITLNTVLAERRRTRARHRVFDAPHGAAS